MSQIKFYRATSFALLLALVFSLMTSSVFAGTLTSNGISLTVPDSYESCTPADIITVTGLPAGSTVQYSFFRAEGGVLVEPLGSGTGVGDASGTFTVPFPYPVTIEGSMTFAVGIVVWSGAVFGSNIVAKLGGQWSITCTATPPPPPPPPPPSGGQGCTPGFWRQDQHFDSWIGFLPSEDFETVFGVDASFDPHTLLDAVWLSGGGEFALARHAVAALLNTTNSEVSFLYTTADVISMVQQAYSSGDFETIKNLFEAQNDTVCPLD